MENIKLLPEEIIKIDELHDSISKNWELGNDLLILLDDWISALKANLFFSSISVLTVVLEKLLRDTLIMYEYRIVATDNNTDTVMQSLDDIEENIEDKKWREQYSFNNICDKLVEYKFIEESISIELKEIYKDIRIPVQHWIYSRFIKKHIWSVTVPISVHEMPVDWTPEEILKHLQEWLEKPMDDKMNLHNTIMRQFVLPKLFKLKSLHLLCMLDDLVKHINK